MQEWHVLSHPELERQITDRISFRKFLGFPEAIPDYSTVWIFRERLIKSGKDKKLWQELQRQLDAKGLKVKKGVIQDATFITSDPGHAKADKHVAMMPKPEEVKMEPGRKRTTNHIFGINFIRRKILIWAN